VGRHVLRAGVVLEVVAHHLRETGVGLGDQQQAVGPRGHHLGGDDLHLLGTATAVGADRVGTGCREVGHGVAGPHPHHRAEVGVEAHRDDDREVGRHLAGRGERGVRLGEVAERLDEDEVDAALDEGHDLLGEEGLGLLRGQGPERRHQLAGRSEVAGDGARDPGSVAVHLGEPVAEAVHVETGTGAAEGVGGEHARARVGVRRVRGADRVLVLQVPELAGVAVLESAVLEEGAHGAVEEHRPVVAEERGEAVHEVSPSR
jgi:hypothetical protein